MNLNELAKEAHQIAVDHGFWDPEPTFGELIALMHSELSEALEEYRAGRPMVWYECELDGEPCDKVICECKQCNGAYMREKPEGIAVELADCIIRILDWAGREDVDLDEVLEIIERSRIKEPVIDDRFGDYINVCHILLAKANGRDEMDRQIYLSILVQYIFDWSKKEGLDMESIIREKMDYNRTRPYRHGGKKL